MRATQRPIRSILLVEDDASMRSALRRALSGVAETIGEAATLAAAHAQLDHGFDLILLDVRLPDGSGVTLAEEASRRKPAPLIIAMSGEAQPGEAFRLAQLGVVQFVSKPYCLDDVLNAIHDAASKSPPLEPLVHACVGTADLRDVQEGVRVAMVEQALALAGGNRSEAARLLRITRQAIQKMLR